LSAERFDGLAGEAGQHANREARAKTSRTGEQAIRFRAGFSVGCGRCAPARRIDQLCVSVAL